MPSSWFNSHFAADCHKGEREQATFPAASDKWQHLTPSRWVLQRHFLLIESTIVYSVSPLPSLLSIQPTLIKRDKTKIFYLAKEAGMKHSWGGLPYHTTQLRDNQLPSVILTLHNIQWMAGRQAKNSLMMTTPLGCTQASFWDIHSGSTSLKHKAMAKSLRFGRQNKFGTFWRPRWAFANVQIECQEWWQPSRKNWLKFSCYRRVTRKRKFVFLSGYNHESHPSLQYPEGSW